MRSLKNQVASMTFLEAEERAESAERRALRHTVGSINPETARTARALTEMHAGGSREVIDGGLAPVTWPLPGMQLVSFDILNRVMLFLMFLSHGPRVALSSLIEKLAITEAITSEENGGRRGR